MEKRDARLRWTGGLRFEGVSKFGQTIAVDAGKENGGSEEGYSPSQLLLFAMIGCTGIDVASILTKMRQSFSALEIEAIGEHPSEYPKPFQTVRLIYHISGDNLDPAKVRRAVTLSHEKYCMVSQTVVRGAKVTWDVDIIHRPPPASQ